MATELIPQTTISVEFLPDGETPAVSSLDVARHFQKKHKDVLRGIDQIRSVLPPDFAGRNFALSEYADTTGRTLPCYRLTRDAFSLLAMGFTGSAAIRWKLRYIEAFNALEARLLHSVRQEALEEGKKAGLIEARQKEEEARRLQKRLTPERLAEMKKALAYAGRGFYHVEIAKMLDCSHDKARQLLRDARFLGMAAPVKKAALP